MRAALSHSEVASQRKEIERLRTVVKGLLGVQSNQATPRLHEEWMRLRDVCDDLSSICSDVIRRMQSLGGCSCPPGAEPGLYPCELHK